jgi:hypothetical protein
LTAKTGDIDSSLEALGDSFSGLADVMSANKAALETVRDGFMEVCQQMEATGRNTDDNFRTMAEQVR